MYTYILPTQSNAAENGQVEWHFYHNVCLLSNFHYKCENEYLYLFVRSGVSLEVFAQEWDNAS